jgi:hypothetical protein
MRKAKKEKESIEYLREKKGNACLTLELFEFSFLIIRFRKSGLGESESKLGLGSNRIAFLLRARLDSGSKIG